MNLLEKYRTMLRPAPSLSLVADNRANTEKREKTQKRLIKGTTSNIREILPVAEVSNGLAAPTHREIVQPKPILEAVWVNPHAKGTSEARQASFMAVMEAVWTSQFKGIIDEVLEGQAKLADFGQATEAWNRICLEEIKGLKH